MEFEYKGMTYSMVDLQVLSKEYEILSTQEYLMDSFGVERNNSRDLAIKVREMMEKTGESEELCAMKVCGDVFDNISIPVFAIIGKGGKDNYSIIVPDFSEEETKLYQSFIYEHWHGLGKTLDNVELSTICHELQKLEENLRNGGNLYE